MNSWPTYFPCLHPGNQGMLLPMNNLPSQLLRPHFRLVGASRLFQIIVNIKSPEFEIEGREWRLCVLDIFYSYFQSIWSDPKVP